MFTGLGDVSSEAQVKAVTHLHDMMLQEATVAAYQDVFMLSAFISLFNVLPSLLQRRTVRPRQHNPGDTPVTTRPPAFKASRKA
jgi:hypothetical protein